MFHKIGIRAFVLFFVFAFAITLSSTSLFVGNAEAVDATPVYVGDVMADANGDVFILSDSKERLKLDSFPMPIFDNSLIQAENGYAIISLATGGIVEVAKGSEVKINKYGDKIFISINSGSIRFSVPSNDMLSIAIPSEGVSIKTVSNLASATGNVIINSGARAGFVELKEVGTVIVTSTMGSLEVSTVEGKTMVLPQGKSMMVADASGSSGTSGSSSLAGSTAAGISATQDFLMLGLTAAFATTVVVISNNTPSGQGVNASGP